MKIKLPDTLILLSAVLAVFALLTWLVPAGEFEREEKEINGSTRTLVVPGTYAEKDSNPAGFSNLILAPIEGFQESADIIVFIFMVAGGFGIILRTGAIEAGLQSVVRWSSGSKTRKQWVIPILVTLFSLGGATFGMSEETLVFILVTLPLSFALGYDSLVGVSIPFVGAGVGFAGAFLNPFTVGIAHGIAGLTPFSGWEYRLLVWVVFTLAAIVYLMRYARKVEKNPQHSLMFGLDQKSKHREIKAEAVSVSGRQKAVLVILFLGLGMLVYGVNRWDWYINEIAGLFLVLGILSAVVYRLKTQDAVDSFVEGARDMVKVGFVIAMAKGVLILARDGLIIDTILNGMALALESLPKAVSVNLMFGVQTVLNFFLPSGSGQAALTMPIMAPLSDLLGISRQTAVLAFQLGDGLSNMIIPTSGVTMGVLTLANIPYGTWFRWFIKFFLLLCLLSVLVLLPPVLFFAWTAG